MKQYHSADKCNVFRMTSISNYPDIEAWLDTMSKNGWALTGYSHFRYEFTACSRKRNYVIFDYSPRWDLKNVLSIKHELYDMALSPRKCMIVSSSRRIFEIDDSVSPEKLEAVRRQRNQISRQILHEQMEIMFLLAFMLMISLTIDKFGVLIQAFLQ